MVLTACGPANSAGTPEGNLHFTPTVSVATTGSTAAIPDERTGIPTLPAPTQPAIEPPTGLTTQPAAGAPTSVASAAPGPGSTPKAAAQGSWPPDVSAYGWQLYSQGLDSPVDLKDPMDGSGRLFVVEKPGRIRILKDGQIQELPFLDITDRVNSRGSEQGLLGLAFHPRYRENGYFYVHYTDPSGNLVISRFKLTANANLADPHSEKILLHIQHPFPNHNGGSMQFGPDGYLYIGIGDGGSEGDPMLTGQSTTTLLAKLLRINVDKGDPYAIPPDNPFVHGGGQPEIWAYGLRNPWRFSFDRQTGDLYIADVGQDTWEEIDFLPARSQGGTNFGWSYREGAHPYKGQPPANVKLTDPVAEYDHSNGCAVTGGYVYRGQALAALQGIYLYGDFCSGKVWGLQRKADGSWLNAILFETGASISSFGQDQAGEVYLCDLGGKIYKLGKK